jgi:nicotinamide mononucleotide transporter
MTTSEGIKLFIVQAAGTPVLEWVAISAGVAEVLLAKANKVLLYPAGILSTVLYTWLFLRPQTRLYADAILNIYYFIMSIYGWIWWNKKQNGHVLSISKSSTKNWLLITTLSLGGWGILYVMLAKLFPHFFSGYVVSDVVIWDALISSTAWVGMWLLARRKIENWILLNISNFIAIPIYVYKGMPFTAALTIFLFIVAIFGYFEWLKQFRQQNTVS